MKFKFWKLIFFFILIISMMISISSNSWMGIWLGLEMNLLSIIPLMNNSMNMYSTESSMKYFITQAMASTIILFSIILMTMDMQINNFLLIMMNSSLLTKMGSAPFHFWFPEVMEGQMWLMCLMLLTIQKITPFCILNYNMNMTTFFSTIMILNMLISAILGFNQISIRKILTFSSINHMGWMIAAMMFLKSIWIYYFFIYSIISMNLILMFNLFNIYYFKQIFKFMNYSMLMKLNFIFNFMSLGGLPPFIGFLPKWLTIQSMMILNFYFTIVLMVILTLITLYYYIRLMFSSMMFSVNLIYKFNQNKIYWMNFFNFLTLMSLFISILYFNF